jgi:hypothetical protein
MGVDSAYTTEFLDGPEKQAEERDNRGREQEQRHADRGMHKNMTKGTDKVKASMDKKRLEYYKKKLLARREELTKTIARTQEEGRTADEGGQLLYQGVSVWDDQYGPHGPEYDRRGAEAHPDGRLWGVCELPGGVAAEAAGGGAVGETLHRLPGEDGAGIVAMSGGVPWKARGFERGGDKL